MVSIVSGDRVRQTEQGCLIVSGREKIRSTAAAKIAAEEIESWLLKHTSIKQVALVAMDDAVMGERACAFVVCHDAPVKAVALRKFLREQGLADYKNS